MKLPEGRCQTMRMTAGNRVQLATCWQDNRLAILWLAAVALPFAYALFIYQTTIARTFVVAALCLQVWHMIFKRQNGGAAWILTGHDLLHAVLLALLLPPGLSIWVIVSCTSFGSVFADRLFGGRGFAFLHPVVVALSFLLFSTGISLSDTPVDSVPLPWYLPGLAGLVLFSLISFRTVSAMVMGAFLVFSMSGASASSVLGFDNVSPVFLVLIFLAANPTNGAATNPGRWVYGMLCGALFVLLSTARPDSLAPVMFSVLLASLSAPLIDHMVVQTCAWRRDRYRHE